MKRFFTFLLTMLLGATAFAQLKKVGYMPSWAGDANAIQYSKLTHINYSFAIPNYDGTLKPIENGGKLSSIVSLGHSNGVKVLVAVGGWSYQGASLDPVFESLAGSAQGRTNLVNACINLVNQYGLDGIDVDWEYPDAGTSANNYAALISELANAMHSRGKVVTAAIPHTSYFGGGYNSSIFSQLDWINLMAYDANDFQHATMQYAIDGLNYWCGTRGLARNKAVLGVPAYGRPSWESYAALLARGANPEADVFGNVGYNGLATIRQKSQYVKDNGYGGIMMWELSQDVNNQYSLISAIHTVLGTSTPPPPPPVPQSPFAGIISIPGKIEAENYDKGGQTISWSDVSTNNEGGAYRMDAVDLEACTEGGFNVGWIAAGEWLEYSVNVTSAATYNFAARVASTSANNSFHLEMDGQRVGSAFVVPNTGGWQTWTNVSFQAALGAGNKILRIVMDQGNFNLNYLQVSTVTTNPNSPPSVSLTAPANGATYNAGSSITLSANASDADGSIQKVEFFYNGTKIGEDNTTPYSIGWTSVAGSIALTARATDNTGATTTSAAINITVKSVSSGCSVAAWDANAVYLQGNRASYNGTIYEAKWWTQNNNPSSNSGTWDVWKVIGPCTARIVSIAGVEEEWYSSEITMHATPNPTIGNVNLKMDLPDGIYELEVRSSMNELIYSKTLSGGTLQEEIPLQNHANGIYLVMIKSELGNKLIRVVKQ